MKASYYVPTPMPYPILAPLEADTIKWICGVNGLGYRLDGATYARISGIKFIQQTDRDMKIWHTSDPEIIAEIWDSFGALSGNLLGLSPAIGGGYFQIQFEYLNVAEKKTETATVTMHGPDFIDTGGINGRSCMIELTQGAKTEEEWDAILAKCELVYPVPEPGFAATYLGLDGIRAEDIGSIEFIRDYSDCDDIYSTPYPAGIWYTSDSEIITEVLDYFGQLTVQKNSPFNLTNWVPLDIKMNSTNGETILLHLKGAVLENPQIGLCYWCLDGMMSSEDWSAILEKCETAEQ